MKSTHVRAGRLVVATLLASTLSSTTQLVSAAADGDRAAGAAAVRGWNAVAMTTLVLAPTPNAEQPLHLAAVQRAVYDAVMAVHGHARHPSLVAAISSAAHTVLLAEFPLQAGRLDQELTTALADIPVGQSRTTGLALGRAAAEAALQERAGDGRGGPVLAVPAPGPGVWSPTPPNVAGAVSWLGSVRPFVLGSGAQLRPAGPPALDSATWARDYNETRLLGSATSTTRTAAQTEVARFWADPPSVQNQRALRNYTQTSRMGALATARLFAMADTAAADALIACFDSKYHYSFWRPFSAIPLGATDNNPATPADASWVPLLPTPNHPEYPSAHSCATTAFAAVVAALAPSHRLDLTLDSTTTGTVHRFTSVRALTDEVANARVWGGIHWRFSTDAGSRIGRSVAALVLSSHDCDDEN